MWGLSNYDYLSVFCCILLPLVTAHNAASLGRFTNAFRLNEQRTAHFSETLSTLQTATDEFKIGRNYGLSNGGHVEPLSTIMASGYFKYNTFYSGCSGKKQTTYLALGVCMLNSDGTYSMLYGVEDKDQGTNTLNQDFYTDSMCSIGTGLSNSFQLQAKCDSALMYTTAFKDKISKPSEKSVGIVTYNTEADCDAENEPIQAVYLPTGCTKVYGSDDDGAQPEGSYKITCASDSFSTATYGTEDCTGPVNVYDDDFYTITDDMGDATICYSVDPDTSTTTDPFSVTVQYATLECSSSASTRRRCAGLTGVAVGVVSVLWTVFMIY